MTIRVAADGSALGNPGPAGWAWYIDDTSWAAGGFDHATNNQAELTAVLQFFRSTSHLTEDLLILCDSQYVINCITKWMPGWKKKGWRKADGKPVLNVDLLTELDDAIVGRSYRFEWVKGHANHPLNEAADSRARAVSEAIKRGSAIAPGPGLVISGETRSPRPQSGANSQPNSTTMTPMFDFDSPALTDRLVVNSAATASLNLPDRVDLSVSLTPAQFARLQARARTRGVTPETVLRDLI